MRDLNDVIEQILSIIPIDEAELREDLEQYLDSDNSVENWNNVGDILYSHIFIDFYPEISWQDKVERIWTGDESPDLLDYSNF